MARVTTDEVKEIIPVPETVTDLIPYITVANNLIEKVIVAKFPDAHTEAHLKEIERWLSAHFTAIRFTRTSSEGIGEVKESYQYKVDLDLRCTMYGQQAIILDTSGALNALLSRPAGIWFVGKTLEEQGYYGYTQ